MALPNCANYPPSYFVNDESNCQAYWYCANANSQPVSGSCELPYNFDQPNQLCNHPSNFPCQTYETTPCPPERPPVDFTTKAVQEHNHYRSIHRVPDVASFSSDINNFAQQWANHLASTDQFYHSSGSGFGENLYKSWGGSSDKNVIVANAILAFYNEIQYYDWNNPGFSGATGHFTQVVWKASTEIGVGVAVYPDAAYGHRAVVSINYRPPGNYLGQFPENVLPPIYPSLDVKTVANESYIAPAKVMVL